MYKIQNFSSGNSGGSGRGESAIYMSQKKKQFFLLNRDKNYAQSALLILAYQAPPPAHT
jgi:hypothetical protein